LGKIRLTHLVMSNFSQNALTQKSRRY